MPRGNKGSGKVQGDAMGGLAKNRTGSRRRHKKRAVHYALPVIVVMTILLALLSYKLIRIKTITVEGTTRYQTGEIIAASGLEIGSSMFRIKPSAVNGEIQRTLSYIGNAQLRFELPDTIVLSVEEAAIIASVYHNGSYVLLSDSYKVLQPDCPTPDADVPVVTGLELITPTAGEEIATENEEDLTILKNLYAALKQFTIPGVTVIELDDITNIRLLCENNNTVLLGGPSNLEYKLEFVSEIIRQYQEQGGYVGMVVNAQAIDGETSLSVSVLPSTQVSNAGSSQDESASQEQPEEDNSDVGEAASQIE